MQRLLIVFLILQCAAAASEDPEGNPSGDFEDDEDLNERSKTFPSTELRSSGTDESKGEKEYRADGTLIIIIAAASVVALAVVAIVATVLFRRYFQSREQGVYSVPTEQGQKVVV